MKAGNGGPGPSRPDFPLNGPPPSRQFTAGPVDTPPAPAPGPVANPGAAAPPMPSGPFRPVPGPGRPAHIPSASAYVGLSGIAREQFNANVPAELEIGKRMDAFLFASGGSRGKRYQGVIAAVALDQFLSREGY